jgi:hypothetical protein
MTFALHRLNRSMLLCLLLAGLLACLFSHTVWADEPPLPSSVWQSVPDQAPGPRKPWVLRDRAIALSPQSLQTLKDAAARPHPPVFIELFDDTRYELDITSTLSRINDSAVIRGLLKNTPHGDFTFFVNGSVMAGTIHVGERLFKIEHVSNGHHRLLELNPAKLPPD